ncbi:MAG: HDOD domain-containing protein [bacterium]
MTGLPDLIEEHATQSGFQLPVFDQLAMDLMRIIRSDDASADKIAEKINQDPGLASEVLRVTNTAYFAGRSPVTTVKDGIVRLGLKKIINLVMLSSQQNAYQNCAPNYAALMSQMWKHTNVCSFANEWVAMHSGHRAQAAEAFMAGLLHDVGKLAMLTVIEQLAEAGKIPELLPESEVMELVEDDHARFGAELLAHWNIPEIYQDAAAYHHSADYDHENIILVITRFVNLAYRTIGFGPEAAELDLDLTQLPEYKILNMDDNKMELLKDMMLDVVTEY